MAAKKSTWIGGTAFASVAIMAGAFFLAINPQMAEASDLRAQTESVNSQNEILQLAIDKLKSEYAHLDEYKADLEELRLQIPTTAKLSDYLRELNAIASAHAVVITTVSPGVPQAFVSATAPVAPTPAPTDETTTDETTTDETTTDETTTATPTGPTVPAGFVAIPVSLTVIGTYANTVAFVNSLQTGTERLFLLTTITGQSQQPAEAGGGRPELALGDQELQLSGYVYVLVDPYAAVETPTEEPTDDGTAEPTPEPTFPVAPPGKNPLLPIAGQ